ncbi:MAG: Fe-S protein assembly co-chaperone HscB [Sandaracinaceae bacterium]
MRSPFDILGVEPRFDLDLAALERRFRELSKLHHPDRGAAGRTPAERRESLGKAMDLNEAYRTLRDDLTRARAVLAAQGVEVTGEERADDPGFLLEVMELREGLGEARERADLATVRRLAAEVRAAYEAARAALSIALERRDHADARRALGRMRYYRRFLDEVDVIEEESAERSPQS